MNLAINSYEAMCEEGELWIRTKNHPGQVSNIHKNVVNAKDEFVCIEVEDTGPSIKE